MGLGIALVALLYLTAATIAGFGGGGTLATFRAERTGPARHFADPPARVWEAYGSAIASMTGLRVVEERPGVLLVNVNPLSGNVGGNYGLEIELTVRAEPTGTAVTYRWRRKVTWAPGGQAAFRTTESRLRMAAKQHGLRERMSGLDPEPHGPAAPATHPRLVPAAPLAARVPDVAAPRPVAGWYEDPGGSGLVRYWDGTSWTPHLRRSAS